MAKEDKEENIEQILLTLSPLEKSILPLLKLGDVERIKEEAKLSATSIKRALQFLASKGLITLSSKKSKIIKLDVNGILYLKKGLAE